jgi:hypothetical protein
MYNSFLKMAEATGRNGNDLTSVKVTEFEQYYDCNVGPQLFEKGQRTNDRELTFKSEADATMFLLRFS